MTYALKEEFGTIWEGNVIELIYNSGLANRNDTFAILVLNSSRNVLINLISIKHMKIKVENNPPF